jgi:hypothetical protein
MREMTNVEKSEIGGMSRKRYIGLAANKQGMPGFQLVACLVLVVSIVLVHALFQYAHLLLQVVHDTCQLVDIPA